MFAADTLHPPIQYSWIWLIIGLCLLSSIIIWYGIAFWLTRRKHITSLATLKQLPSGTDIDQLKAKYLALIEECYQSYQQQKTTLRGLHRGLSMAVRYFVYEAKHFPAHRLTLADLRKAPYPNLTKLVEDYYAHEFAVVEQGDPLKAVKAAKKLVREWV